MSTIKSASRKRLNWELPKERHPATLGGETVLRAVYELLRLALEWEVTAGVQRAGLGDNDVTDLRGTFDATEGEQRLLVVVNLLLQRQDARREQSLRARIAGVGLLIDNAFKSAGGDAIVRAAGRGTDKNAAHHREKLRIALERLLVEHLCYVGLVPDVRVVAPPTAEAVKRIIEHFTTTHRELKRRTRSKPYKGKTEDSQRLLRFYDAFHAELRRGSFGDGVRALKLSPSTIRNISRSLRGVRTAGQLGTPSRSVAVHRDDDGHFEVLSRVVEDAFRLIAHRVFAG